MAAEIERLLSSLPEGANVAMVSMLGSLCPITLGHVQCFEEARKIILADPSSGVPRPKRLQHFDECLGLIQLNGDGYVLRKVREKGQKGLDIGQRGDMARLATADHLWLNYEDREARVLLNSVLSRKRFEHLNFVEFEMNGADDVVKYAKWTYLTSRGCSSRMIVMGRPGFTSQVLQGMAEVGLDRDDGKFIVGPELPDVSSTAAREASQKNDLPTLLSILHPSVADFLLKSDGHTGL